MKKMRRISASDAFAISILVGARPGTRKELYEKHLKQRMGRPGNAIAKKVLKGKFS